MSSNRIIHRHYLARIPNRVRDAPPRGRMDCRARGKVGQGGYGCVYRPPFDVKPSKGGDAPARKTWTGYVTKAFINNKEAIEEMRENEAVNKMDPKFSWHLRSYGPYVLESKTAKIQKEIAKCSIIPRAANSKSGGGLVIQYEDGGVNMYEAEGLGESNVAGLARLCRGVRDMAAKSYCHLDVKSPNIVFSPKTKRFNFIDFGFGTHSREIVDTKRFLIGSGYFVLPMDLMYVAQVLDSKGVGGKSLAAHGAGAITKRINAVVRSSSLDIISHTINVGGGTARSVYNPHDDVVKHNIAYLDKCVAQKERKNSYDHANAIVEAIKDRIDVFGLGLAFMDMFAKVYPGDRIFMPEHFYSEMTKEQEADYGKYSGSLKERFGKLICKMCNPRIERRLRAKQLVKEFSAMMGGAAKKKRGGGATKKTGRSANMRRTRKRSSQ
jgi:serine/threonine protein kinase